MACRHGSKQGAVRYWALGRVLCGQRVYRHEGTCRDTEGNVRHETYKGG